MKLQLDSIDSCLPWRQAHGIVDGMIKHGHMIRFMGLALAWAASAALYCVQAQQGEPKADSKSGDVYLFTSFRDNGESGLFLALSTDGRRWSPLNHDKPVLRPEIGANKLMRDPCLVKGPKGDFHMVWTTGWTAEGGKVIGYANTKDLIHWSPQKAITLMHNEPKTRNLWAPELFYDDSKSQWIVFWSSTIPGRYANSDGTGDDGYNHRIYCATTHDFETFTESCLFFEPGFNVIDATLFKDACQYKLVFKDERKLPVKKNLRMASSSQPEGPFGPISEPFTTNWVEGPSVLKIDDYIMVYFDHYTAPHYYGAVRSKDWEHWEDVEVAFPKGHRHGSGLAISKETARRLVDEWKDEISLP